MDLRTTRFAGRGGARPLVCLGMLALGAVQCGSSSSGSGSAPAGFAGTYQATWSSTATFDTPAGLPAASYTDTGVITVTAQGANEIAMVFKVGSNPTSGSLTFVVNGDSATATAIATGGTCFMGTLTNGAQQTTCATQATAHLDGDQLTQAQSGKVTGVNAGVSYSGTYQGTWTGTRIK